MSTVVARALAMIAVVFQSYFDSDPGSSHHGGITRNSIDKAGAYHLAGLVLARGGSKGIPKKNLVEVNGRPLVARALDAMIESGVFTTIWISTDDPDIMKSVKARYLKNEVEIHKRAAYTATDSASSISAVLEFLSFHPEIDAIGLVQATSPFVNSEYLQQAADKLLDKTKSDLSYDSVFSVTRSHQLRWTAAETKKINDKNSQNAHGTKPLNFDPKSRLRRQEWEGEMVENGMFYFTIRHVLVNYQSFQADGSSSYVEIPKHLSMEIDSVEDLDIARCIAPKIDKQHSLRLRQKQDTHQGKLSSLLEESSKRQHQPKEL